MNVDAGSFTTAPLPPHQVAVTRLFATCTHGRRQPGYEPTIQAVSNRSMMPLQVALRCHSSTPMQPARDPRRVDACIRRIRGIRRAHDPQT